MFKLVAAFLILPTAGLCAFFPSRRLELHPAARFAVLTLLGTSLFCMEFFLLSVSGLPWSTAWVALPAVVGIAVGIWRGSLAWPSRTTFSIAELVGLALACVSIAFLAYALLTARATSIDYVYFWGTKGFRFASAKAIDTAFLTNPDYLFLHPDYPPVVPLVDAAISILIGRVSWWTGLVGSGFFALCAALAIWGFGRRRLGTALSAAAACVWASFLAYAIVWTYSGGNGEPVLLFFEASSLCLLLFAPPGRSFDILAGVALADVAMTKVEGAVFVILCVALLVPWSRSENRRRLLSVAAIPALTLVGWLFYSWKHGMFWAYGRQPYGALTLKFLGSAILEFGRSASYGIGYLPWIAGGVLWVLSPSPRAGLRPAMVGVGYAAFSFFCFLHGSEDPTAWIHVAAPRLLTTSVLCLTFAAAVSSGREDRPGVPPPAPAGE